jgi:protein subunit release factor A
MMDNSQFKIQYYRTPRQGVNECPVGVRVTDSLTGLVVDCDRFDRTIENRITAMKEMISLLGNEFVQVQMKG